MDDWRSSNHSLSLIGGGDGRCELAAVSGALRLLLFDLVFVGMDPWERRQQAIEASRNHQGFDCSSIARRSSSVFSPSSVSAASADSSARTTFRASPPAAGVKSTTKVPHDSWPTTASQSAPSFATNRRIGRAPTRSEVETQPRAQRPVVRSLPLYVELRGILEVEFADIILCHQSQPHRLAEREIRTNTEVRGEVGCSRVHDRLADVVAHRTRAHLGKWLQREAAGGGYREIELQSAVVQQRGAVRDGVAAQERDAGGNVGAGVADISDE